MPFTPLPRPLLFLRSLVGLLWVTACAPAVVKPSETISPPSLLATTCSNQGPCIFSEELDCDSKDFFRGAWDFGGTIAFGECYAPPGVLPTYAQDSCLDDSDCDQGAACQDGACSATHNYFCAKRVDEPTTYGCNDGDTPECSEVGQTCTDEWFECPDDATEARLVWPDLGDACEDIILTYEIVAEQFDADAASSFCSKRHADCNQAVDCSGPERPSADHCGPTDRETDALNAGFDCFTGDNPVPACPPSDDPGWPEGIGASMDLAFILRAEQMVGEVCAAAGCSSTARCRPDDISLGYSDGGLGIQGESGIKDDSFIGHARVCDAAGEEQCNPRDALPCVDGPQSDDSRDALVPGAISHREVDIRCQCVSDS